MRLPLALALVLAALVAVALLTQSAAVFCAEDMACWDCHTMGNKICGPTS